MGCTGGNRAGVFGLGDGPEKLFGAFTQFFPKSGHPNRERALPRFQRPGRPGQGAFPDEGLDGRTECGSKRAETRWEIRGAVLFVLRCFRFLLGGTGPGEEKCSSRA